MMIHLTLVAACMGYAPSKKIMEECVQSNNFGQALNQLHFICCGTSRPSGMWTIVQESASMKRQEEDRGLIDDDEEMIGIDASDGGDVLTIHTMAQISTILSQLEIPVFEDEVCLYVYITLS
jgi:hypothetical protein